MHILIIEDENRTASYLQKGFREHNFIVDVAYDGQEGLFLASNHQYDLIILDVMLPKIDGWSILQEIRKLNQETRVLFLTARNEIDDRVKGLELGADDYLVKPFAFSELLARVRSILRRNNSRSTGVIHIADLLIDLLKHKATRNSVRLDLTPKEFSLLVFLAQRSGEVLSRTLIAEKVWDINFDSDTNVIDVAIKRLRKKVDDPFDIKLIHTVRSLGYTLEER